METIFVSSKDYSHEDMAEIYLGRRAVEEGYQSIRELISDLPNRTQKGKRSGSGIWSLCFKKQGAKV